MTDWPPAATAENMAGQSEWVLVCEHASCHMPAEYDRLGLAAGAERDHIGWDIGAAALTRAMARRLDSAAILANYSRLLIDLNRPLAAESSIPTRSEETDIPGNASLDEAERARRVELMFTPFHRTVADLLDRRRAEGRESRLLTVHSFTPVYRGQARPWHLGILAGASRGLAATFLNEVAAEAPALSLALDEPYRIAEDDDYAIPVHGDARGLDALLIEVRNDQLRSAAAVEEWAGRLCAALGRI
ncbi:N-formylglutamate amidohydrolase [Mesorhizobium australicum]|uniref:N-formylglutamate amidohydrolase n=1 Tax=Mesorhizobium australicum TaxID=536018 RepID=UPI001FCD48AA|nr:N-formylglutamate amidohydrolase [Mesorhizobium australicum]